MLLYGEIKQHYGNKKHLFYLFHLRPLGKRECDNT